MELPEKLKKFQKKAEILIKKGLVDDLEFSGPTYQVHVLNSKNDEEGQWAFLQLDSFGELSDSFCACEESEVEGVCIHVAAAFLRIYNGRERPIHARFRDSLWNELCIIYLDRVGDDPRSIDQVSDNLYIYTDNNKKMIFSIEAKNSEAMEKLETIFQERYKETEETSLKFSSLNEEELSLWRQGKPTPQLRYELSFWNDIAKKLMILQDSRKPYNIIFEYSENKIPVSIKISFPEWELFFNLRREDLIQIIPFLSSINSPLSVHTTQREAIQEIRYNKKEGALIVELKEEYHSDQGIVDIQNNLYHFGGWNYVPREGFYALDQHHILAQPNIVGERLAQVLDSHSHIIKKLLVGDALNEDPVTLSYHLHFDENWTLHIVTYLFQPGDLSSQYSRFFGKWVYLENRGFYPVEGREFEDVESEILPEDMSSFISQYKMWLNTIHGFETHLTSIEVNISYFITEEKNLVFRRLIALNNAEVKTKDFGFWVYVEGEGFYSKINANVSLSISPDTFIQESDVSSFIKRNREELHLIPNFFNKKNPLIHAGLKVESEDMYTISINPEYKFSSEYEGKYLQFFEDFIYVENEGFYEIPLKFRLPQEYRKKLLITNLDDIQNFLENDLPAFSQRIHTIDNKLFKPSSLVLETKKIVEAENRGKGIYGFQLVYHSNQGTLNFADLWKIYENKRRYCFSEAGRIDLEEDRFGWIHSLTKKQIDLRSNTIYLSALDFIRINAFDELKLTKSQRHDYEDSKKILDSFLNLAVLKLPDYSLLKSTLRPYQETGLHWLWFLYLNGLSGLLCDDMGLGKTHQSMALIASIHSFNKKYSSEKALHFLVVCPTSVIYHWQEKLEAFLPTLRICTFHGINRSFKDFQEDYDILLTSYGVWRNEVALLRKVPFELAIFDEIQVAKNHSSGIHKSLLKVQSTMRLGLTGTPIENRIRELKSLYDIVLPKYMPGEKEYIDYFVKPIEKDGNLERKNLLSRYVKPFILRRKKEDVLTDLPPKIEEIFHCELLDDQFKLYSETLQKTQKQIIDELKDDKNPVPYIHVFAILSQLKQICDHPAVYHKDPENYENYQSGKWNLFVELLNEARESQQKVVVFSQYLLMLDIIEKHLKENSIEYSTIRGSTLKRGDEIQRFNNDPNCEVFVGSLQATGLGIDLTAASVVIHYDRWWNAAREDQATDRVHRIGQKRGVQVFKLVTKNTFEEKIDALITRKGKLMEEVIGTDDHNFVKKFTREELIELLQI